MARHYFIQLSRKDVALVSCLPGTETSSDPAADWVEATLLPAARSLALLSRPALQRVPITLWLAVRPTVRRPAEIFLFVTPGYPPSDVRRVIEDALRRVDHGKVSARHEMIPEEAFPCCQVFRGRFMRLYSREFSDHKAREPRVSWLGGLPRLSLESRGDPAPGAFAQNGDLSVEAVFVDWVGGERLRQLQQSISTVAREAT